ncbi:MAG: RidA family protein [Pseudomonadota bacterium]
MPAVTYLNPETHIAPPGRFSHVAIAEPGRLAFVAGQVALDEDGVLVGPNDPAAQFPQVFRNLKTILEGIGAGFTDIVELTTYLVGEDSRQPWLDTRDAVYAEHFPDGAYPPNTLLIISGLVRPEMKVEVSAIVRLPG